jgi:hypothetical protein
MKDVGKPPARTKNAVLERLKRELGALRIGALDRERFIRFGRDRAKWGSQDIGAIKLVILMRLPFMA